MITAIKKKLGNYLYALFKQKMHEEQDNEMTLLKNSFCVTGKKLWIDKDHIIYNAEHIKLGENFSAGRRFRMEAISAYQNQIFAPEIIIGDNVNVGTDVHIACVNKVEIKSNCLLGSRILITDHQHGQATASGVALPPACRDLVSKGIVMIEENVWIGDGVVIMPNVVIGNNTIIAANAVVTKDIPANVIAGGIPAKVIKEL